MGLVGAIKKRASATKKAFSGDFQGAAEDFIGSGDEAYANKASNKLKDATKAPSFEAPAPLKTPKAPEGADATLRAIREQEARTARLARGVGYTRLTTPFGVQGQANVRRKTLLGQ